MKQLPARVDARRIHRRPVCDGRIPRGQRLGPFKEPTGRADTWVMGELTVRRWRRYGKDRLYVSTPDGRCVGWVDVVTGRRNLDRAELREAFELAVARHLPERTSQGGAHAPPPARDRERRPPSELSEAPAFGDREPFFVKIDYTDLAVPKPGQAAREQAAAHRRAAPVRTLAARVLGVHTDERAWRIGAAGEQATARNLERLPAGWTVLHAVPVGDRGADIDHVVIGPAGVFTVNTKHHPTSRVWVGGDTFLVNGQRQPYVRNSRHEAQRARRLLTRAVGFAVPVMGVIAVLGASGGFVVKSQPDDVVVAPCEQITGNLLARLRMLSSEQLEELNRAARRSTTWC